MRQAGRTHVSQLGPGLSEKKLVQRRIGWGVQERVKNGGSEALSFSRKPWPIKTRETLEVAKGEELEKGGSNAATLRK